MKNIEVELIDPTGYGALIPKYDKESAIVEVTSPRTKEWRFGIDIDGWLIFDIDENFILENFDFMVPEKLWEVERLISPPGILQAGELKIDKKAINQKSFNFPDYRIITNKSKTEVMIYFYQNEKNLTGCKLSSNCVALIKNNYLMGFYLRLN